MTDILQEYFETGLKFHGHKCPAMPMGLRAGLAALRALGVERAKNKELMVISETGKGHAAGCFLGRRHDSYRLHLRKIGYPEAVLQQDGVYADRRKASSFCTCVTEAGFFRRRSEFTLRPAMRQGGSNPRISRPKLSVRWWEKSLICLRSSFLKLVKFRQWTRLRGRAHSKPAVAVNVAK